MVSRVEIIRAGFRRQGFSSQVVDLLVAGKRNTTHAAYQSAWSLWYSWCLRWGANPVSSSLAVILDFLGECFQDGKAYSTINVYRLMLSDTLAPIDGHKIDQHPVVIRLLKGI